MASMDPRDRYTHSTPQEFPNINKIEQPQHNVTQINQLESRTSNIEKTITDINKKLDLFSSQLNQLITVFLNGS